MCQNMQAHAGLPITSNPCPHINAEVAEVLLVLCALVLAVSIDAVITEMCLICKEH
jgi:hypothetical protein